MLKMVGRFGWVSVPMVMTALHATAAASTIAPLYTVTDLGSDYTLQQDASGTIHGITSGDGGHVFSFEKLPVTEISVRQDGGSHAYSYTLWTLQNGPNRVGYNFDYGGGLAGTPLSSGINYPTFEPYSNGWFVQGGSPVADLNIHGQVVGTSVLYSSLLGRNGVQTYAAFSDPNGRSHGFGAGTVDNLNSYIASDLNVQLTAAVKIDDSGRIIARGTLDGLPQDFLLTPAGLPSDPIPTPEPTALLTLAVGTSAALLRGFKPGGRGKASVA